MSRDYVRLSADKETAYKVGIRHGKSVVLQIDIKKMIEDGNQFYLSENGVWIANYVSFKYIIEILTN